MVVELWKWKIVSFVKHLVLSVIETQEGGMAIISILKVVVHENIFYEGISQPLHHHVVQSNHQ